MIAIIAILAAILFPVFSRAREQARKSVCMSNAKQIATALMMYAQDWDETLPVWNFPCAFGAGYPFGPLMWTEQLYPYIKNWKIYSCPSATQTSGVWPSCCYPILAGRSNNALRSCYSAGVAGNYGFNEHILVSLSNVALGNNYPCAGTARLASLADPSNTLVIADSNNNFITGWRVVDNGIIREVAYANDPSGKVARHMEGEMLVFADGHAKWYKVEQIRSYSFGGTIRAAGCDLKR